MSAVPHPVRIVVRWLALDAIDTPGWACLHGLLDQAERARAGRLRSRGDRDAFVAAHALARLVLSEQGDRPPAAWRFRIGRHGKPDVDGGPDRPRFSLSRTHGLVAVAVASGPGAEGSAVGVDVEWQGRGCIALDVAGHAYAPEEVAWIRSAAPGTRPAAALGLWTLKESYVKATGLGLSCPLDAFAFTFLDRTGLDRTGLDRTAAIRFTQAIDDDPDWWQFGQWRPSAHHVASVAIRRDPDRPIAVQAGPHVLPPCRSPP